MRNEEVLQGVREQRNILRIIKRRKANWIGHILRRNRLLKCVIEGKIEGRIEGNEGILETERGSTRSYSVENSLWKRLLIFCKTDYRRTNE